MRRLDKGESMRYVTRAQKHISSFISHSSEDNEEARHYESVLSSAGFTAFQYGHGLPAGDAIRGVVRDQINKCHFFLLIVSDYSLHSHWVQKELGLALAQRKQNHEYRPIIIPLYAKSASWRASGQRPKTLPTRDFETGEERELFDLDVRGLDRHANPDIDSDELLVSQMRPHILVSRRDFDDESTFTQTDPFKLYKLSFPVIERDDTSDIIEWVLRSDIGQRRKFRLADGTDLSYRLDSRYFILSLWDRAIGLAFFTYDYKSRLIDANYMAIQEAWRGGDIASAFVDEAINVLAELFPKNKGVVFEV